MITAPRRVSENLVSGRVLVWTEIDIHGAWLDIDSEDDISEAIRNEISIPDKAKPNYRSFDYLLDERTHKLYVEAQNELGQSLGPRTTRNIVARLMERDIQGNEMPDVEVTLVPDERAVNAILTLPGLRVLTIRVVRPNPDETSSPARRRVMRDMEREGTRVHETKLVKSTNADRIVLSNALLDRAEVAAEDGFVHGEGRQDGKKVELTTDKSPRIRYVDRDQGETFFQRIASVFNIRR